MFFFNIIYKTKIIIIKLEIFRENFTIFFFELF